MGKTTFTRIQKFFAGGILAGVVLATISLSGSQTAKLLDTEKLIYTFQCSDGSLPVVEVIANGRSVFVSCPPGSTAPNILSAIEVVPGLVQKPVSENQPVATRPPVVAPVNAVSVLNATRSANPVFNSAYAIPRVEPPPAEQQTVAQPNIPVMNPADQFRLMSDQQQGFFNVDPVLNAPIGENNAIHMGPSPDGTNTAAVPVVEPPPTRQEPPSAQVNGMLPDGFDPEVDLLPDEFLRNIGLNPDGSRIADAEPAAAQNVPASSQVETPPGGFFNAVGVTLNDGLNFVTNLFTGPATPAPIPAQSPASAGADPRMNANLAAPADIESMISEMPTLMSRSAERNGGSAQGPFPPPRFACTDWNNCFCRHAVLSMYWPMKCMLDGPANCQITACSGHAGPGPGPTPGPGPITCNPPNVRSMVNGVETCAPPACPSPSRRNNGSNAATMPCLPPLMEESRSNANCFNLIDDDEDGSRDRSGGEPNCMFEFLQPNDCSPTTGDEDNDGLFNCDDPDCDNAPQCMTTAN